jgi:TusA-related sulfurtransferase
MNDNRPAGTRSEIEMLSHGEKLTVIFSDQADVDLIETAARLLRAKPALAFVEMHDTTGGTILAYRGDHPAGKAAS